MGEVNVAVGSSASGSRKDRPVAEAINALEGFTLSPNFTTRGGYCARFRGQPALTEPLPNEQYPEQAQIHRFIRGPGNTTYGDVQADGTIELSVRPDVRSGIDVAATVRGYGILKSYLIKNGFKVNSDEIVEQAIHSCSIDLGYMRSSAL